MDGHYSCLACFRATSKDIADSKNHSSLANEVWLTGMFPLQVLAGKGSQIAKHAAAHGCLPQGTAVQNAIACDLDALQKLSLAESTLVSWVQEVVSSGLPAAWQSAGWSSAVPAAVAYVPGCPICLVCAIRVCLPYIAPTCRDCMHKSMLCFSA